VHTSEDRAIKHGIAGYLHEANISWQLVSLLDNDNIAGNKVQSRDTGLGAISHDKTLIRKHGTNGSHDTASRPILPRIEGSLNDPDSNQDTSQRQISLGWRVAKRFPRDEDQDTGTEENTAKASKEISHDLTEQPRRRRRHLVLAMLCYATPDLVLRETLICVNRQTATQFINIEGVPVGDGQLAKNIQ
jgi:hypothetical protein